MVHALRDQRVPRDHCSHLSQALLVLALLLSGCLPVIREAELLVAHRFSPGLCFQGRSRADQPGFPGLLGEEATA